MLVLFDATLMPDKPQGQGRHLYGGCFCQQLAMLRQLGAGQDMRGSLEIFHDKALETIGSHGL